MKPIPFNQYGYFEKSLYSEIERFLGLETNAEKIQFLIGPVCKTFHLTGIVDKDGAILPIIDSKSASMYRQRNDEDFPNDYFDPIKIVEKETELDNREKLARLESRKWRDFLYCLGGFRLTTEVEHKDNFTVYGDFIYRKDLQRSWWSDRTYVIKMGKLYKKQIRLKSSTKILDMFLTLRSARFKTCQRASTFFVCDNFDALKMARYCRMLYNKKGVSK